MVQHNGGYQNEILFAERNPATIAIWDVLQHDGHDEEETKFNS